MPQSNDLLLSVSGLHAGYGRAEVLTGLNLKLPRGSVVTVIGPNGAGKSTTLNALMGLLPSRGQLLYGGVDISRCTLEERVMQGIALVPEKRELFSTMAVEDNLVLGGFRPMRLRKSGWRDGLATVYELFPRLKERRTQLAGTLSGGEQQMLAMARAIMLNPEVVLLDEPSMGLAPILVAEVFKIIERLKAQGVTMLLVEQFAAAALGVADYGYVLENGRISVHGPAEKLRSDPAVKAAYLGGSH